MDKQVFVYIDNQDKPCLVGQLWARWRKGRETASFEYSQAWLQRPDRFALEPALMLVAGPQHTPADKTLFGALGDSAPDRWGRLLMRRQERRQALAQTRAPHSLMEIDYLLAVNDFARQGALRFSETEGGPFLSDDQTQKIPPLMQLPKFLAATERIIEEAETDEDIRLLFAPGSSLGGARPKASVIAPNGNLCIAKFPSTHDEYNTVLWEALALHLAKLAGIAVPQTQLEMIAGKPVLLLQRFDRVDSHRIPFLSAMSMLGAKDNEPASYLEIAEAILQYGASAEADLKSLWRRLLFNILISNTDDHLRNHGFLYKDITGWQLSPAYDLNPVPTDIKPRVLTTTIDYDDGTASLELALSVKDYFGINDQQATQIIAEVAKAVTTWRHHAKQLGIAQAEIVRMESAFEHDDLQQALMI